MQSFVSLKLEVHNLHSFKTINTFFMIQESRMTSKYQSRFLSARLSAITGLAVAGISVIIALLMISQ